MATPAASPLAIRDFRLFWMARLAATMAQVLMVVVIGWQVYDVARATMPEREAAFLLGMVGLAQFLPLILLTFVVGYIADRLDRRWVARAAIALELACAVALAGIALADEVDLVPLFVVAALLGVARAFASPSLTALAPNLVPLDLLPRAIALNSVAFTAGAIIGPPIGGYLYAAAPPAAYFGAAAMLVVALGALLLIRPVVRPERSSLSPLRQVIDGLRYVRANPIVLGSISLDLVAVLMGGATALLPVYARDVLEIGPEGLGHLRAAPAVGAAIVAAYLARYSLGRHVGRKMFVAVALFGIAIAVFGVSENLVLSLGALAVSGAADMISVYVRQSLVQIGTPDAMRGRVASVSTLFISASNELGEFRAGVSAALIGAVPAVVLGGIGATAVAGIWAWLFPALRHADSFTDVPVIPPHRSTSVRASP